MASAVYDGRFTLSETWVPSSMHQVRAEDNSVAPHKGFSRDVCKTHRGEADDVSRSPNH